MGGPIVPKRNLAWILVVAIIALLMWQLPQTIAGRDSVYKAFGPLVDVRAQIERRFVEPIDDDALVGAAVRAGIDAMVDVLNDPHAIYLDEKEYERFKKRTEGVFGGVGVDVWSVDNGLEVLSREPNSPAAVAGIMPGDVITHIDGKPAKSVPLVEAVNNWLNGSPDSEVVLTVVPHDPSGATRDVALRRAVIQLDPIRGWSRSPDGDWRFLLDEENQIAYVRLTKFTGNVADRLDERVNHLLRDGLRGLVLDLRENTGGLLSSAIDVADRFLDNGLIVCTRGRTSDEKRWYATHDIGYPQFPVVVLINDSTASAAEIVAGSLRDHHRAEVVGERSYGKGSVQEVVELDRQSGAIKLTTAYYYLPSGHCIQRTPKNTREGNWGVAPTVPVNLTAGQRQRWLEMWRQVSREAVAPASQPANAATEQATEAQRKADGEKLLKADVQLRKALQVLRREVRPAEQRRGETTSTPAG
jgi:carboxyl-terminal processing protease